MPEARVFVSAPLPGDALASLSSRAQIVVGQTGLGLADPLFARDAGTYDAILTLLTDRVDAALLAKATRLRVVANVAVGVDNVDLAACAARGVLVTNTPGVLTEATADLAFALLLAAARRVGEGERMVRAGLFRGWTPTLLVGAPVHGSSLGIVGFGRIGQAVARRARGFGMHVLYAQPRRLLPELERALGATYVPLPDLFGGSDAVSLHCPLTDATRRLVDAARLSGMKRGSVLVNTSRGACVDEEALAASLESGHLAAAGLDVFEDEPRVHPALLRLPNVVLTPHIGSADRVTREAMAAMAVENAIAVLDGAEPPNLVRRGAAAADANSV
jgi:glyoxylate reductase